jgi:hypothetical protein
VPAPVKQAANKTLRLHRAVSGHDASTQSFVEALVGEAFAGPHPPDGRVCPLPMARDWAALERLLFQNTNQWSDLSQARGETPRAMEMLAEAADLLSGAGRGGPAELCHQMIRLLDLEDRLQRQQGKVLATIGHQRGWSKLGFAGLGHYAEQRLGISRTTARDRARLYRGLLEFPVVRQAYESGDIGFEATLLILRVLGRGAATELLQRQWVERARRATVKRLRDEVQVAGGSLREPLGDSEWHASLRLAPGQVRQEVKQLGLDAIHQEVRVETIGLTLPVDLARDFLAAIAGWRDAVQAGKSRCDTVAGQIARSFSAENRPLPMWVGLFAMLEDFADTWDDPAALPKRKADRIYIRDGWRCTAPGCSSRKNLESHHLEHLSQGGHPTAEDNQSCACRFHHQLGEHGLLASCKGKAPLDITWRLGREDLGTWYRNELEIESPEH